MLIFASALAAWSAAACSEDAAEERSPSTTREEASPTPEAPAPEEASPVGEAPDTDAERQAVARAREAAQHLGRTLKSRLMGAMAEGPDAAIEVCAAEAQALTRDAAEAQNARVGRSSLKLRNPENRGPEWVTAWLEAHGERAAQGVTPVAGITGDPPIARFVGPIPAEGPCLMCHGAPEGIPEEVRSVLSERYPDDAAIGYAAGDLRGAIWAEVPVETAQ